MSKVAIIGLGRWGKVLLNEFKKQTDVKYECDSKSDLNQVWEDTEVTSVIIAVPTPVHYEIADRALDAGKHVFLEKPGTTSYENLDKLVKKAKEKNLRLAVGYEYPHHPVVQKIKELIGKQQIDFIRLEYQKWGSFKDEIVRNLLCHDISILKFLNVELEEPRVNKVSVVTEADIIATRFSSRAMSIINRVNPVKVRTALVKISGSHYIWNDDELFEIVGEELKSIEITPSTPVAMETADFLLAIKENREPLCNGEFALEVYRVIELAQASIPH